ncbi:sporulation protein YpjB [Bacillus sp. Marseille-P3661]|uniref:sporulation protein YpjB n=1 Tax=Bacillus sp. Marseille-P3661 TaxID=1936234 RepID=UPI000C826FB9|nr:sporulation protein YpjB [Bacillus sp. Marseille-P3661]
MRKIVFILLFLMFFSLPHSINAQNDEAWSYLDDIVDQALLLTKQEKYEEAKKMLTHFSEQFMKTYPKDENITMNDLRVITITTDEALKALTAVNQERQDSVKKVTQLRLAIDALHSEHQPLWKEMENTILKSFNALKSAALNNENENFKQQFNEFSEHLSIIYPSLVIDLDPDQIAKLDSHIRFLEKYDSVSGKNKKEHLELMEKDLLIIFGSMEENEVDPSFIWVMVTTGSIIFSTLLYVGWRKYKSEQISTIKFRGRH